MRRVNIFALLGVVIMLFVFLLSLGSYFHEHICPQCHAWMAVSKRVLEEPTYTACGSGEMVRDCAKCKYHCVSQYSISRLDDSNSSSSSSDGGGGSSDGGGSADGGGGGGADW